MATIRRRDDGIMEIVGAAAPRAPGGLLRMLQRWWGDLPVRATGVTLRVVREEAPPAEGTPAARDAGASAP